MIMKKRVKRFICKCEMCGTDIVFTKAKPRRFCSNPCKNKWQKTSLLGKNNPAYGKTYRTKKTHPAWARSIRKTAIENEINVGDKNAMKRPDVAKKMSETRRQRVTSDPEYRRKMSETMKRRWADGKYDGVPLGRCKWYTMRKKDGTECKLQGMWELKYAQYLDSKGIKFRAHRGRFLYIDATGSERSYFPDFYLIETDEFIDVKSEYHLRLGGDKIKRVSKQHPEIVIRLVMKQDLIDLGIKL